MIVVLRSLADCQICKVLVSKPDAYPYLESVSRKKTADLRKFTVATQRLNATSLTVNDKLALVKKAQAKYAAQKKAAEDEKARLKAEEEAKKQAEADAKRLSEEERKAREAKEEELVNYLKKISVDIENNLHRERIER